MNVTPFTPGPWRVDGLHVRTQGTEERPSGDKIAQVQGRDFAETPADHANARLIAAAPALLEACKGLSLALEEARREWGIPLQLQAEQPGLAVVIAAAEGGLP